MKRIDEVLQNRQENYIFPFFWQHGETEEILREYMGAIYDANIRAVCVESRPHPDFCGSKWWQDMDVILDEAKKRDMKVWILDDSHFPTGFANGAMAKAPDRLCHQYLVYREFEVCGPAPLCEIDMEEYLKDMPAPPWMPPQPAPARVFDDDRLAAVLAYPVLEGEKLGEPVDLTNEISDGKLIHSFEAGYWRVFVTRLTRNAKGRNDYINFLDKESCRILLDAVYEPHYEHYKELFGSVIAGFFSDEPPVGNTEGYMGAGPIGSPTQNLAWSAGMEEAFTREFGSDGWRRSLGYLWAEAADPKAQAKVRTAYMNAVSKLVAECFSAQNGDWCRAHGVEYIGHMLEDCDMSMQLGPSMGHFFRGLSGQDMAGIDNIGGQVMIGAQNSVRHLGPAAADEAGFYQYLIGKLGASAAAIEPKKKGRCLCENFGAYGWQSGTRDQKYMADHFMARGVNRFVPHAFSAAPFPDPDCPPHFYAHGENPQYRAFGELMSYMNRVCHLISDGKSVPDAALLYNAESAWAGKSVSNIQAAREMARAQIDFQVIPADIFKKPEVYRTEVTADGLTVNGNRYKALVISGCDYLDPDVAAFLENRPENFPVIFTEFMPENVKNCGCVTVPRGSLAKTLREVLEPETVFLTETPDMTALHYSGDGERWILLNENPAVPYTGSIRVHADGVPFRYLPWENRLERVNYTQNGDCMTISLRIEPLELTVLFFEETEPAFAVPEPPVSDGEIELTEFQVSRAAAKDYPQFEDSETLQAPFAGMQIQYPNFSGWYAYETEACLEPGADYVLEADHIFESAEVFINGQSVGTRVQAPYRYRFSAGESGKTRIRLEAATTLERRMKAENTDIYCMGVHRPLMPTGIVGRVVLRKVK